MQNNNSSTGQGAPMNIDVNDPNALRYWAGALQVTEEALKDAVAAVGSSVGDVCRVLHVRPAQPGGHQ